MLQTEKLGFPASRRSIRRRRSYSFLHSPVFLYLVVFLILLLGAAQLWPQNSDMNLKSCETTSPTWNALSNGLRTELTLLQLELSTALDDLQVSKTSLMQWMSTSEQLNLRTIALEAYNEQIAEQLRQNDEDIYKANNLIVKLEKKVLRLIITVVAMGAVIIIVMILFIKTRRK